MLADDTVARALLASRNAVIEGELAAREARGVLAGKAEGKAEGEMRGKADGLRTAITVTLAARGLVLSETERARLDAESVHETLQRWLTRAVTAARASEVFEA